MQLDAITPILRHLPTQGRQGQAARVYMVSRLRQIFPLALVLFALWVVLSGKFDAFHLLAGALSAFGVSIGTHRLLLLPPTIGPAGVYPVLAIPWIRLLMYIPWLSWQIVLSSLHVAWVVLHPRMPIDPCVVRFRSALPHTLARLTLANSITLTPGTVTLDVEDDTFLIHALTTSSAAGLDPHAGEAPMHQRVEALYTPVRPSQTTGVRA